MLLAKNIHFGNPLKRTKVFLLDGAPLVDVKLLGVALNWPFLGFTGDWVANIDINYSEHKMISADPKHFSEMIRPGRPINERALRRQTVTLSGLIQISPRGDSNGAVSRRNDIADLIYQIRRAMDEGEFIETPTPVDDGGPDIGRFESYKDHKER